MRIDMNFPIKIKRRKPLEYLLKNGKNHPPRPWEVADGLHPYIFTCNQGAEEFWLYNLWIPFWCRLSAEQRDEIKNEAPDEMWIEWLDLSTNSCEIFLQDEELKKDTAQDSAELDHYTLIPKYDSIGLLGVPLIVALATFISFFQQVFLF
jgi:hypothetical protein